MRIGIVAESFLPNVNGVVNSVLRVLDYARARGHEAFVIAPGARDFQEEIPDYLGFPVYRVPTVMVPLIDSLPVGVPVPAVVEILRRHRPDVVHLASPFVLGAAGAFAARRLVIPAVAVYQTDVAGFSTRYRLGALASASWAWTRAVHNACQRTLAPSSATMEQLRAHGIGNIHRWGRGVDAQRFHPDKRCVALRRRWDPTGSKKIVGFVGRLAAEKGVHRLAGLDRRAGIQLVIVGDGPERGALERLLPGAVVTGQLGGEDLARAYACLDVFVHPGEFETFCQAIQEAQASGVPTIGPRAGGPRDLIEQGRNGLLLDVPTFARELPAAVDWVLDDSRHELLRRQSRAGVAGRTWEAQCERLLGHYREAIGEARGRV
ncbi:glycosyltransferase family 1 protein [Corynebacterium sp. zg-331]|uniref:glycosyltransferase family 4 protein n=1 Tax=unclassified Corynebacterium TaxID=2624378 RepID=UPI00128B5C4E|nr:MULTISPECIES: glycosyltransferase family 1 protein [unclassified Corynebacterium]MBC3186080.1 glycosyltransferase family 1 protein [Corynebacterium sp. zg-331]MPV52570.1 glycosyltransferase [Corynebacterium sp. zg331]